MLSNIVIKSVTRKTETKVFGFPVFSPDTLRSLIGFFQSWSQIAAFYELHPTKKIVFSGGFWQTECLMPAATHPLPH